MRVRRARCIPPTLALRPECSPLGGPRALKLHRRSYFKLGDGAFTVSCLLTARFFDS